MGTISNHIESILRSVRKFFGPLCPNGIHLKFTTGKAEESTSGSRRLSRSHPDRVQLAPNPFCRWTHRKPSCLVMAAIAIGLGDFAARAQLPGTNPGARRAGFRHPVGRGIRDTEPSDLWAWDR